MSWEHPTGNAPKVIAIVGLGPTQQDWHAAHVQYTPPVEVVDEVWTVNKGFRTINCDLCFVMDDLMDEARKSPRYAKEIAAVSGDGLPMLTSTVDAPVAQLWPKVQAYPLKEVLAFWGEHVFDRRHAFHPAAEVEKPDPLQYGLDEAAYFNNSIPYMLAYAGMIGIERVYMFGCDYSFPGNVAREDDRANAEYWIAALQFGLGVAFRYSSRTTLCSRDKGRQFYGFNGRQPF